MSNFSGSSSLIFWHPPEYQITGVAGSGAYSVVVRANVIESRFANDLRSNQVAMQTSSRQVSAQYCSDAVFDAPAFPDTATPVQLAQRQASSILFEQQQSGVGPIGANTTPPGVAGDDVTAPTTTFHIVSDGGAGENQADVPTSFMTVGIKRLLDHCSEHRAVPPEFALHYLRKICREVSILRHFRVVPQVIPLLDLYLGPTKQDLYIVMPYVQYNLKQIVTSFDLEEALIKWIMMQVLLGLRALHASGVIHRDITLTNILVDGEGQWDAWLSDFGLSRARETSDQFLTTEVVTLPYRAPEVLMEYEGYTTAIDIWAAGCVMAECFLRKPFLHLGDHENPDSLKQLKLIMKQLTGFPDVARVGEFASQRNADFIKVWYSKIVANGGALPQPTDVASVLRAKRFDVNLSDDALNVLRRMLVLAPRDRATAEELLHMPWFTSDEYCSEVISQAMETLPPGRYEAVEEHQNFEELQATIVALCADRDANVKTEIRPTESEENLDLGLGS